MFLKDYIFGFSSILVSLHKYYAICMKGYLEIITIFGFLNLFSELKNLHEPSKLMTLQL